MKLNQDDESGEESVKRRKRRRLRRLISCEEEIEKNSISNIDEVKDIVEKDEKVEDKNVDENSNTNNVSGEDVPDDSDSEDEESSKRLKALYECLNASKDMVEKLINNFSSNTEQKDIIESKIYNGRSFFCETFKFKPLINYDKDTFSLLKEYQKAGIHWLLTLHEENRNGILADEMGLVSIIYNNIV